MSRQDLARRQQHVLQALLEGDLPDGFDERSAAMTTRVLRTKRRSEAIDAVPALATIPDFAARFDAWAARRPRRGCAHDDVVDFLADDTGPLPEPSGVDPRRRARLSRQKSLGPRSSARAAAMGHRARGRVWHVGPR